MSKVLKALIVDDDPLFREQLKAMLVNLGYEVTDTASSGAEAIVKVKKQLPDFVVMDIVMDNELDGVLAAQKISEIANVPIIFSSGKTEDAIVSPAMKSHPFGYLNKPIRMIDLKTTIEVSLIRYNYENELKEYHHALEQSEALFRGIYNSIQSGYLQLGIDFKIKLVNPELLKMLNLSESGYVIGQDFFERLWAKPESARSFRQKLKKAGVIELTEAKWVTSDGKSIQVIFNVQKTTTDDPTEYYYTCTAQNITLYKNMENQLRHAQKMKVIGTLSSRIAHEINNQLTSVLGYADLCQRVMDPEERQYKYIKLIQKKALEAVDTTRELLRFGHNQKVTFEPLVIDKTIREKQEFFQHILDSKIKLILELNAENVPVVGSAKLIEQVLVNLTINARDAMPEGGQLTFRTRVLKNYDDSEWGWKLPSGEYLNLSVIDDGTGIPADKMDQIFEPFYTTKPETVGTGLGLSVVQSIIEEHKSYIFVSSEVGVGTRFELFFPVKRDGVETV